MIIGSRAAHTAADGLAAAVDVFPAKAIRAQGTTETAQIRPAPSSVNFPRQSVSDASEIVRAFTMRGWGLALGPGSLGLFAEYRDRNPTNRAGPDASEMFGGDADGVVNGELVAKNNSIAQPNHHWGDGASKDLMTFATFRMPFATVPPAPMPSAGGVVAKGRDSATSVRRRVNETTRGSR